MKILAIDTSTSFASVAIAVDEQVVAESLLSTNRTLSARLVPEIERLLTTAGLSFNDIDIYASTIGPGSFTGVRGGIATIQGLALATGKPCAAFSSLALLAMNFSLSPIPVCVLLDARKSEVYAALYNCSSAIPTPIITDCVLPPALLLDQIAALNKHSIIFVGDGAVRYHDLIAERLGDQAVFAPYPLNSPHAANGTVLALHASRCGALPGPGQLLPLYLRASDAEINRTKNTPGSLEIQPLLTGGTI
ncbi:MAG TPA: tRNA (adenosine(37)-N6)-threonylcarbamoyltransferase complex dimerization subunit type 1 TsaB [Desulfuromonadales bacterium]|nr:tRNA (adenosine(37)-N6)-threonylcarbamoyltransferase complex dimerization subunit type 1 TsaB [Desulfuromonadales bacterium]